MTDSCSASVQGQQTAERPRLSFQHADPMGSKTLPTAQESRRLYEQGPDFRSCTDGNLSVHGSSRKTRETNNWASETSTHRQMLIG